MAKRLLQILALWTFVIGIVQCCPELCRCYDRNGKHLAACSFNGPLKDLQEVPVGLPSNVSSVFLSSNKIKFLKSKSFINITQVTALYLAHNRIVTIERGTLAHLTQLVTLDISYNKIVNFPWEDLVNLTALHRLRMNNNEMVNLPMDAFSTLEDLEFLSINNNKFTTIVQGTFSALSSLSHLQIFNNPFACSCSLEWLRDWVATTNVSVPELTSIVCDTPENLKGMMVTNVPKLDCEAPAVTVTSQPNIEESDLYEGVMVILNCVTKGSPTPQVSWEVTVGNQNYMFPLPSTGEMNDKPINDKTTRNRFLVFRNGSLIIPRLSEKENGNYSCTAVNDLGKAEGGVKVVLTVSPETSSSTPGFSPPAESITLALLTILFFSGIIHLSLGDMESTWIS